MFLTIAAVLSLLAAPVFAQGSAESDRGKFGRG